MISKLLKYGIFSVFFGIVTYITIKASALMYFFGDWRLTTLITSCIFFIIIIAVKRGVWH